MILVDTSVWINRLRGGASAMERLLDGEDLMAHPFVIGELALGGLAHHHRIVSGLRDMWQAVVADDDEVVRLILDHQLVGTGIGYIDTHLLASARLAPEGRLWTDDRRLLAVARRLGVAYDPLAH